MMQVLASRQPPVLYREELEPLALPPGFCRLNQSFQHMLEVSKLVGQNLIDSVDAVLTNAKHTKNLVLFLLVF